MTEEDQEQEKGRFRRFWADWWGLVVAGSVVVIVVFFFGALAWTGELGTGFFRYTVPDQLTTPDKTLWDWMELLLVPIALALAAAFFAGATNMRQREIEKDRIKEQQRIERDRSQQAALQTCIDRVSALLRSKWRESGDSFIEANLIGAQTKTVLRQLDDSRKGLLLKFLYESGLIGGLDENEKRQEALIDLTGADLKGAHLTEATLSGATLSGATLSEANLSGATLSGAALSEATLSGADLRKANLSGADLRKANLVEAKLDETTRIEDKWRLVSELVNQGGARRKLVEEDLSSAWLSGADLRRANLAGATLSGATLSEADLRRANLSEANLKGADLRWADLRKANLSGADLRRANLSEANLKGATVTDDQLAQAKSREGAMLPNGTIFTGEGDHA